LASEHQRVGYLTQPNTASDTRRGREYKQIEGEWEERDDEEGWGDNG
jgi:hypothetical protein